jgi:hypothetical protein
VDRAHQLLLVRRASSSFWLTLSILEEENEEDHEDEDEDEG